MPLPKDSLAVAEQKHMQAMELLSWKVGNLG